MKNFTFGIALISFVTSLSAGTADGRVISVAHAAPLHEARYMTRFGETLPPMGYIGFCRRNAVACEPHGPIVDRVTELTHKVMADEEVQKSLITSGFEPTPGSGPEQASRMVADELARWTPIIKATGFKME